VCCGGGIYGDDNRETNGRDEKEENNLRLYRGTTLSEPVGLVVGLSRSLVGGLQTKIGVVRQTT